MIKICDKCSISFEKDEDLYWHMKLHLLKDEEYLIGREIELVHAKSKLLDKEITK